MKKFKWIIWIAVIAIIAVLIWFWKFKKDKVEIVLLTEHPQYGTITNSVTATGTIQPVDTVAVGTQVSGTIQKVYVDFNSPVKKGQLLAQIDRSLMEAQAQQISANLQSAQANVTYQKSNYDRQTQLFNVGAISKAELETALYQYKSASENVKSINAQLSSAQKNLSYTQIYSPIDGTVLSRNVSEGQTVAASLSTPTLFSIAKDLSKMQVQAAVDEADIGNVKPDQRVIFSVDAFPEDTFGGIVKEVRLRPSVSSNVVTYTTIIDAPNAQLKLKPGMTASISIYTKEINNALIISAKATSFRPDTIIAEKYTIERKQEDRKTQEKKPDKESPHLAAINNDSTQSEKGTRGVVWVKKDSTLSLRHIRIGMTDETQVQVLSGLTTEDEVVTGYQQISKNKKSASPDKSPFLPARTGGNRNNRSGTGGSRPPR
jgi:HlyD family secretion protein